MFSVTLTNGTLEVRTYSTAGMTETAHKVKPQICNKNAFAQSNMGGQW
jgi:hypothetical protein